MPELVERPQQAVADRHRIERKLGASSMATMHVATDLRHGRHAAVKVLTQARAQMQQLGRGT